MLWCLIHRAIFYELLKVFLLAFVGLTGLLLMAGVISEATRNGLNPAQILAAIPLLVPSTIPYTLPTTTLFATCVIYGRLANDSEILALRAAGVHIRHAVWPVFLLGTIASVLTFVLYMDLIPYTHYVLRSQVAGDMRELLYGMLKRESCIRHPRMNYEIHVTRVEGQKLKGAQFRRRDAKNQFYDVIAFAKEAELLVDMAHKKIYVRMKHCYIKDLKGQVDSYVEDRVWPVEMPDDLSGQGKYRPSDMTWSEMFEARVEFTDKRDAVEADIATYLATSNLQNAPDPAASYVRDKRDECRRYDLLIAGIDTELHQRPAFALGCLCFVMVGCPVGIWFSKSDYLSAFITCFLPIVIVYYPLMLCAINMAKSAKAIPVASIWTADALMLGTAIFMYRRLARY